MTLARTRRTTTDEYSEKPDDEDSHSGDEGPEAWLYDDPDKQRHSHHREVNDAFSARFSGAPPPTDSFHCTAGPIPGEKSYSYDDRLAQFRENAKRDSRAAYARRQASDVGKKVASSRELGDHSGDSTNGSNPPHHELSHAPGSLSDSLSIQQRQLPDDQVSRQSLASPSTNGNSRQELSPPAVSGDNNPDQQPMFSQVRESVCATAASILHVPL